MVTGVETAGLVLGSIPLILAGLQFYADGVMVSRRYWRYRTELEDLVMEISSEHAIYVNTINLLLKGIVGENDMIAFLATPCGVEWKNAHFDNLLKDRLGQTYQSYLHNINIMNSVTEEFKSKLKLASTGTPQFAEVNLFKEHYRRLKFSVKKSDYGDLTAKLRRANSRLHVMTTQISSLESAPAAIKQDRNQFIPRFRAINDRAQGFYSALCSGWKCPCHANHSVNLRLESRMDDVANNEDSDDDNIPRTLRNPFHVVFRYSHYQYKQETSPRPINPWTWEEADVRIVNKGFSGAPKTCQRGKKAVEFADEAQKAVNAALKPVPNLQPIQDLCKAISTLGDPQKDVCLELLATEFAKQQYGYHIYPSKNSPTNPEAFSLSTLRQVLQDSKFTRHDRIRLAVTLASSVLQLHETPWLDQNWSKDSIFFIKQSDKTLYDHPFVSRYFNQKSQEPSNVPLPAVLARIIRNQTLYRLGVSLIELWYGRSLGELHNPEDGKQNTGDIQTDLMTEWTTADRLIDDLYSDAGGKYTDAVRRCIRCDFDHRASNLEDVAFQKAVYDGVVSQLKHSYEFLYDNCAFQSR